MFEEISLISFADGMITMIMIIFVDYKILEFFQLSHSAGCYNTNVDS